MNSLILTSLASFFKWLWSAFCHSTACAFLTGIYNAVSRSWNSSVIMGVLRKTRGGNMSEKSLAAKILGFPFTFLAFLKNKLGAWLKDNIAQSFICEWAKTYIQNFMAVNTRFFGVMLIGMSISYCAARMSFSKAAAIAGAIGAIGCIFNFNLMSFLNPSKAVGIIKNAAGFKDLDFEFFEESRTHGKTRLILALLCGILTGAAISVSYIAAALPFAVFGMILVLYAPITGVYAAVFAAPFVPTMILAGLCLWTALALVIKSLTTDGFRWRLDASGLCLILLLAVLLLSSLTSFARGGSLKVWAMYLVFVGFYFVIINTVKTKQQLYGLLKLFVISGALVALYGVMQYAFGWTTSNAWIDEEMFEDATMRVYSTLGNPNVLGEYLLLVLPVAAVYMIKDKWKELSKWAYGAMFLVLALCLVLTQSRGCWIGFMVSVALFVTFYEGKWWGLIPVALCILPFVVPQTIVDRLMSVGNMEDSSTSYRVYIWMGTLGMMRHYWLGGIGMGEAAFSQVYPFFSYNAIIAPHSHNLFLQLLVEAGVGGLGIFIAGQTVFMKKMSDLYRLSNKKHIDSMLALAFSSGVMGFLVQSMFDYTFYNYRVMAVFFMVMAMAMSLYHIVREERA